MGIYQGLSEYKPDTQASASILAYTRLRFGLVLVRNYLPLAVHLYNGPTPTTKLFSTPKIGEVVLDAIPFNERGISFQPC